MEELMQTLMQNSRFRKCGRQQKLVWPWIRNANKGDAAICGFAVLRIVRPGVVSQPEVIIVGPVELYVIEITGARVPKYGEMPTVLRML